MNAAMGAPAGDRLASIYTWLEDNPTFMRIDTTEATDFGVKLESAKEFSKRILA